MLTALEILENFQSVIEYHVDAALAQPRNDLIISRISSNKSLPIQIAVFHLIARLQRFYASLTKSAKTRFTLTCLKFMLRCRAESFPLRYQ